MSGDEPRPILIRKKKVIAGGGHHGGAWKVAYADFVTAMMAFFLLMWLLNATSEEQRKGLADYFNPDLPISRTSAGGAGMLKGDTIFTKETASGSIPEGVPPQPTHLEPGQPLGDEAASPDAPPEEPQDAPQEAPPDASPDAPHDASPDGEAPPPRRRPSASSIRTLPPRSPPRRRSRPGWRKSAARSPRRCARPGTAPCSTISCCT